MRRRNRTVTRLVAATVLTLIASVSGQASLECDGYFDAGYFSTTYYLDGYWPESACGGSTSTAVVGAKTGVKGPRIGL